MRGRVAPAKCGDRMHAADLLYEIVTAATSAVRLLERWSGDRSRTGAAGVLLAAQRPRRETGNFGACLDLGVPRIKLHRRASWVRT
jgi:hypothetical protein